jgi:hypothetical protein
MPSHVWRFVSVTLCIVLAVSTMRRPKALNRERFSASLLQFLPKMPFTAFRKDLLALLNFLKGFLSMSEPTIRPNGMRSLGSGEF